MSPKEGAGSGTSCQCLGSCGSTIQHAQPQGIEVSPFCATCLPAHPDTTLYPPKRRARIFQDRRGLMWECLLGDECPHAIVAGGRLYSCRMRTQQIRDESRGRS